MKSISEDGRPITFGLALLCVAFLCLYCSFMKLWMLGLFLLSGILAGFSAIFFRDPIRRIDTAPENILSPADGKVLKVMVMNDAYVGPGAHQVSIFMSPLDVHVNRAPISGRVEKIEYHPGRFLGAFRDKASLLNEQLHIGIAIQGNKMLVKLIAGFLARRIVWDAKEGDIFLIGQKIAFIRFGSRADLILPAGVSIKVKAGDRVKAGITVVAYFPGPGITGK